MDKNITRFLNDHKRKEKSEGNLQFEQSAAERITIRTLSETKEYLNGKQVFDTFHFLLGHLIVDKPTNPVQYLHQLLDDCILFRSGLKEPRLFWTKRHVDAVFKNVSIGTSDHVSLHRYKIAMKALGTPYYNVYPDEHLPGYVDRDTFSAEVLNSLKKELTCIVSTSSIRRVSPGCECRDTQRTRKPI